VFSGPNSIHICLLTAVILTLAASSAEWKEKVLYSFQGGVWHNAGRRAGGRDGVNPNGGLVLDAKGAVYGSTPMGGNQLCNFGNCKVGWGIVFELTSPERKA
jgi:hypothetical protein